MIAFASNRIFVWAFAKLNPDLIFETLTTIREVNPTKTTTLTSVLIFYFCYDVKGGPRTLNSR